MCYWVHWKGWCLVTQSCPWNSLDQNTGVGIFPTQGSRILGWVTVPFSRGSSRPRDQIQVSCIADRFFIIWATREAKLDESHAGIKIARRNINNLRYARCHPNGRKGRTTEEPLDKGERGEWKSNNFQKTKIMASSIITWWQTEEK